MHTTTASALLLGSAALLAQGPAIGQMSVICQAAGASENNYDQNQGCMPKPKPFGNANYIPEQRHQDIALVLAAKQVNALNTLIAEVQQLRKEVATNTTKLEDARQAYNLAGAKAAADQAAWRVDALESVLADIRRTPAALASNSELRRALVPAVAADLVADKAFLNAVHGAGSAQQSQANTTQP
jgi:hypothetical protein